VPRNLAARLIVALTVIVVIAEGLFGLIILRSQQRQLREGMVIGADQLSRGITAATWHAMLADRRDSAYEIMQTIAHKQGVDRIRIFNKEGRVMFSTAGEEGAQVDTRAEACYLCHAEAQPLVRVDVPSRSRVFRGSDGRRKLAMVTPIYNEPACSTAACHAHPQGRNVLGVLDVAFDLEQVDRQVAGTGYRIFAVIALEVAVIAVFIAVFTRRVVGRPIRRLMEATRTVSHMNLDVPVRVEGAGELGALAVAFEAMRQRLRTAVAELNSLTAGLEAEVEKRSDELRQAQLKLVQADRLASLGTLAASVAHEINNPLAGIANLGALMQRVLSDEGLPPERAAEFRRYVSQVVAETERASRIVSDLLAFSRHPRQGETLADLNEVVVRTLAILAHKLESSGVVVEQELQPDLPAVRGNASELQQVVLNLVVNGAEAMPDGGPLRIRTSTRLHAPVAVLEVADRGTGIAAADLPHIFDPFFTTKPPGKGVGLGLAVVYGIVSAHGGAIDVQTAPGTGTAFVVTLPIGGTRPVGADTRAPEDAP